MRDVRGYTPRELADMSDDQLAEIEKYLTESIEQTKGEIDDITAKEIKNDFKQEIVQSNTNAISAAAQGALQGASFGFSDEIASSQLAIKDTIEGTLDAVDKQGLAGFNNVLSTYKENYTKHHTMLNDELKQLERDHPYIYNAADIAGSLGVGLLTGGTSLYAKAGTSIVGRLGLIAGEGFVHGMGRSNMETLGGMVQAGKEGAMMGAAFGAGGMVAGKLAQKGIQKGAEKLSSSRLISFLSDSFKDFRGKVKDNTIEFADRMVNYTNAKGKPVLNPLHTIEEALDSIQQAKLETNDKLSSIYGKIDSEKLVDIDSDYVHKRLIAKIVEPIASFTDTQVGSSKLKDVQAAVRNRLNKDFTMPDPRQSSYREKLVALGTPMNEILALEREMGDLARVPKELNISTLNRLKNDYFEEIKNIRRANDGSRLQSQATHIEKAAYELVNIIDEEMKSASGKLTSKEPGMDIYGMWRAESKKYKDLKASEKLLDKKITSNEGKNWVTRSFSEHWGKMSMGAGAAMAVFGIPFGYVVATAGAINAVAKSPLINKAAAIGMNKIADAMKRNPDKYSKIASKLAVASEVSSDAFYERLLEAGAEVDLSEAPLQRTMDDVVARQDSLFTLVDLYDPEIGPAVRNAVANGDSRTTGMLLTTSEKLSPYLAKGMGWEGKALSKKDVQVVGQFIDKLKPRERRRATLEFKKNNIIPQKLLTGEHPRGKEPMVQYEKIINKVTEPEY